MTRKSVPTQFTVGESLSWKKDLSLYSAAEYQLTYSFRGQNGKGFDATATSNGSTFIVNVTPTQTAAMKAGQYSYQAFVTKTDVKILVDSGDVLVSPNLAEIKTDSTHDSRSGVKRTLDNINAVIEKKATSDQLKYSIGNRSLERYSFTELLQLRKEYERLYAQEQRANDKNGGVFRVHKIKFGVN
jgi:hypothetical protein